MHGKQLITIEDLTDSDGQIHPVQKAMIENNASQCGFCAPGFIMSLYSLYQEHQKPSKIQVNDVLAGNLCRCTGYGPIIDAALEMNEIQVSPLPKSDPIELMRQWKDDEAIQLEYGEKRYFAPVNKIELAELLAQHPDATILSGGTDVGLWVTKSHKELPKIIYIGAVSELNQIQVDENAIHIGAVVNIARAMDLLGEYWPDFRELLRRFGSTQIRNAGTVGGNIANGSPIGDTAPALMALNARITLAEVGGKREIPLDKFFIDYGVQNIKPGEFLEKITIPLPKEGEQFRAYKLSKRFDQDISTLLGAFRLKLEGNRVVDISICFGGMAATSKRVKETEKALLGALWVDKSIAQAFEILDSEIQPISDMRGGSEYRRIAAKNLLKKFLYETTNNQGYPTRVREYFEECLGR